MIIKMLFTFVTIIIVLLSSCLISYVSAARILDSAELMGISGGCTAQCQENWSCPDSGADSCDGDSCGIPANCGCTQTVEGNLTKVKSQTGGTKNSGNCDLCCGPRWDCDCVETVWKCSTLTDDWCGKGGVNCYLPPDCTAAPPGRYGGSYKFCW